MSDSSNKLKDIFSEPDECPVCLAAEIHAPADEATIYGFVLHTVTPIEVLKEVMCEKHIDLYKLYLKVMLVIDDGLARGINPTESVEQIIVAAKEKDKKGMN